MEDGAAKPREAGFPGTPSLAARFSRFANVWQNTGEFAKHWQNHVKFAEHWQTRLTARRGKALLGIGSSFPTRNRPMPKFPKEKPASLPSALAPCGDRPRWFFWMVIGIFVIAVAISGLSSYLSGHRLVGRKVLPNFNPDDVATIEIDGATTVSKVDGHWIIVPFDGYPANDDLIMHNLRDVEGMTVCAVERNSRRKNQVMEKKHKVVFRDKDGEILGRLILGDVHLEVNEGFVDTIVKRDGRYMELDGEAVLVKPVLRPFSGWCCDWITAPVLMMPDDLYALHWRNRNLPIMSIDYKFDGDGFKMEKDSEGRLELTYAKGVDELSKRDPSYLFNVSFQRIESLGNFRKRHKGERMASGSLTICTTDGTNTHSRTAYLYRRSDDTCYVVIGDWVYVKEYWDSRTWFPPRKN